MEATQSLRKLRVVVSKKVVDPVDDLRMKLLVEDAEQVGVEQLTLIGNGQTSISEARYAVRVHAAIADSIHELSTEQLETLIRAGFIKAGVMRK